MKLAPTLLASAVAAVFMTAPAAAVEFKLPPQCTAAPAAGGADHAAGGHGGHGAAAAPAMAEAVIVPPGVDPDTLPGHVRQNLLMMDVTVSAMHEGMMHEDADIAFACAMIAHHQGAVDMAQVLLEHGQDEQMRALAEKIIAAQLPEIAEMTDWLASNAK